VGRGPLPLSLPKNPSATLGPSGCGPTGLACSLPMSPPVFATKLHPCTGISGAVSYRLDGIPAAQTNIIKVPKDIIYSVKYILATMPR